MPFPCYFDKAIERKVLEHELPDRYAPCLSCKQDRGVGCRGELNCGCIEGTTVVLDRGTVAHRMPDRTVLLEGADRMFPLSRDAIETFVTDVAGWKIPEEEILSEPTKLCHVCGNPFGKHEVTDYDFGDGVSGLFLLCTEKGCVRGDNGVACFQLAMKEYDPRSWLRRMKGAR